MTTPADEFALTTLAIVLTDQDRYIRLSRSQLVSPYTVMACALPLLFRGLFAVGIRLIVLLRLSTSILAILQLYAALSSLSLSIFGTAADSVFDPLANFVLLYCHKKAEHVDYRKYPSGGSKFETIGALARSSAS